MVSSETSQDIIMKLFKSPKWLKFLYKSLVWHIPNEHKVIYLTFDDGPIPEVTPWVLETLRNFNAKATFFCVGDNIRKHHEILLMVEKQGHKIGNHTYHHLNGWTCSTKKYIDDIAQFDTIYYSSLFRPPQGVIKWSQIRAINRRYPNTKIIMWGVLSRDYDTSCSEIECLARLKKHTRSGSIVVFHDSIKTHQRLKKILPEILQYWHKKGYRFEVIPS